VAEVDKRSPRHEGRREVVNTGMSNLLHRA